MSKTIWTISTVLAIALSSSATAHDGVANDAVGARMYAMEIIAQNLKIVGGMAQGQVTFDADKAQAAIGAISEQADNVPALLGLKKKTQNLNPAMQSGQTGMTLLRRPGYFKQQQKAQTPHLSRGLVKLWLELAAVVVRATCPIGSNNLISVNHPH